MIGVVIVAHGGLAREFLAAVEHVLGRQQGMRAISIGVQDNRQDKMAEIAAAAEAVDVGDGVVIVTDMFGGSPSNLSMPACACQERRIIFGANLPMIIKLTQSRELPVPEAAARAIAAGRKYLDVFDAFGNSA